MLSRQQEEVSMVTVFSKPKCVQCAATIRHMKKNKVVHEVINLAEDPEAFEMVMAKGFSSAPVVNANGVWWSGYNPDRINEIDTTPTVE
jgi:glutaredoxin-like protein NrdH